MTYDYQPKTKEELKDLIKKLIEERGNWASLNDIDVSQITDMSELFYKSQFKGTISDWNVSNVKDMHSMFEDSQFNDDLSKWDVSNVEDMSRMFWNSKFNGDISSWNTSKVRNLSGSTAMRLNCWRLKAEKIAQLPKIIENNFIESTNKIDFNKLFTILEIPLCDHFEFLATLEDFSTDTALLKKKSIYKEIVNIAMFNVRCYTIYDLIKEVIREDKLRDVWWQDFKFERSSAYNYTYRKAAITIISMIVTIECVIKMPL